MENIGAQKSQFEFETSKSFLANRNREITAVGMLIETFPQRSNIAVADYESANDVEYIFKRDLVVVMNLNILSSINLTQNFLDGNAVDESGFWFKDETITGQVGYTLRNFGAFSLS